MSQQDTRAAQPRGVGDNLAHWQIYAYRVAIGIAAEIDAARAFVDMRDPQHFVGVGAGADETAGEEVAGGIMAGKQCGRLGRLNSHALNARLASASVYRNKLHFGAIALLGSGVLANPSKADEKNCLGTATLGRKRRGR